MSEIAVIGAGISGLTTAYELTRRGHAVTVFEKSPRVGGVFQAKKTNDYLFDLGPQTILLSPELKRFFFEAGLEAEIRYPDPRAKHRFVVQENRFGSFNLTPVPLHPLKMLFSPIISFPGKLRALLEPLYARSREKEDENLYCLFRRHFGREFTDELLQPMFLGVWASDLERLSARATLPRLWEWERQSKSLLKEFIRHARSRERQQIISFKGGLSTLPEKLASLLPESSIVFGSTVENIEDRSGVLSISLRSGRENARQTYNGRFSHAVVAVEASAAANMLSSLAPALSHQIEQIPYAPLAILHLSLPSDALPKPLEGFGFLVPPSLGLPLLGAIYSSSLFPERAPSGKTLLTCFVGGNQHHPRRIIARKKLQDEVVRLVQELLEMKSLPDVLHLELYDKAIPNYPLFHHELQRDLETFSASHPSVKILGNWNKTVSIPGCISEARACAELISNELQTEITLPRAVGA